MGRQRSYSITAKFLIYLVSVIWVVWALLMVGIHMIPDSWVPMYVPVAFTIIIIVSAILAFWATEV